MNFTFQSDGLAEISRMLDELGDKAAFVGSHALYEGAGRMADAIFAEIGKKKN